MSSRPAHRPLGPGKGVLCSLSALNRCPQGKSPATRTKSRLNWKTAGPRPRGRWPAWQETVSVPAPPALVATACVLLHSRRRVPARAPGPSIQSTRLCPAGPGLPSPRVLVLRCRRGLLPARRWGSALCSPSPGPSVPLVPAELPWASTWFRFSGHPLVPLPRARPCPRWAALGGSLSPASGPGAGGGVLPWYSGWQAPGSSPGLSPASSLLPLLHRRDQVGQGYCWLL